MECSIMLSLNEFDHLFEQPDGKKITAEIRRYGGSEQDLISQLKTAHRFRFGLKNQLKCKLLLSNLCEAGCSEEKLTSLLFNACVAANCKPIRLLDTAGLSTAQVKALQRDLLHVGSLVDRVNKTSLSPKFDLKWASPIAEKDSLRETVEHLYDMLPIIMRVYAVHLGQFAKFNRKILRRLTLAHYYALKLLQYIHEITGSPRYQVAADLLAVGFPALAGAQAEVPNSFSADALTRLYQRTTKLDKKPPKKT